MKVQCTIAPKAALGAICAIEEPVEFKINGGYLPNGPVRLDLYVDGNVTAKTLFLYPNGTWELTTEVEV